MVSKRTACDRLVGRLVSYGEPEGVRSRLGMGMFLLRRVYEGYLSGEGSSRSMGSRRGWWRMDRRGSFIGICIFILGAGFLGGPGCSRVGLCIRWM